MLILVENERERNKAQKYPLFAQKVLNSQSYLASQVNTVIFSYRMKGKILSPSIQKTGLTILD